MIYDPNRLATVIEPLGGYAGSEYVGVWPAAGVTYTERRALTPNNGGGVGSFFTIYVDSDSGDTKLQGGTVTGGSGTETIADIVIKSSGSSTMAQTAGTHMYIHASGSGVVEDGVLLPGWNQSTATVSYGATVPSNDLPTASSASGDVYVDLGVFTEDNFLPAKAGPIDVAFCPGTFTITR